MGRISYHKSGKYMQLKHYFWVLRRWLWLILLGTLVCTSVTFVVSKLTPPTYEASSLIQVNAGSGDGSTVFSDQALALSYAVQVTSSDVLRDTARRLSGVTVSQLQTGVSASPLDNTQVIEVRADARTAQQAADIANTVVTIFIQHQIARESAQNRHVAATLTDQINTAKNNVNTANTQLTKLESAQASANDIAHQKDVLDGYQANYTALLASYNQLQQQQTIINGKISVVQTATLPATPKTPRTTLNTAAAAALSLVLMLALALLLDWIDATVKTPEDVARLALLEPLGSVPFTKDVAGTAGVSDAVEQAFVTITTSFGVLGKGKRSILVTGLHTGAGTSTIAIRLARSLAQAGMRTLLIDANTQKPSLHTAFQLQNTTGLTNILDDTDMFEEQIGLAPQWLRQWATNEPDLWVLPIGSLRSVAKTTLRTAKVQMFMDWLLQPQQAMTGHTLPSVVDIVLFDAPSLEQGANTIALAPVTDGAVLVVEAGKERAEDINKAQATLQRLGTAVIGVVINRQQAKHRSYIYAANVQQVVTPASTLPAKYPAIQTRKPVFAALPETPVPSIEIPRVVPPLVEEQADTMQHISVASTVKLQKKSVEMPPVSVSKVATNSANNTHTHNEGGLEL